MGCFEKTMHWVIMLISLAETLFTTYYFDEDKYGIVTIALVFCFEPILDSFVKQLMNCTVCDWDNFVYDLISEGIQCLLYIHFCDNTDLSKLALPLMMAGQVFPMILLKMKEKLCHKAEEKSVCHKFRECATGLFNWSMGNCQTLVTSLVPLIYLVYQEESPYRQKAYEMALAGYYWTADVAMQYQMDAINEYVAGDGSKMASLMTNSSWTIKFTRLSALAFSVYGMYLAWTYWFSPEIEVVFPDKVFTMISMILSVCVGACMPFFACQVLRGEKPLGGEAAAADLPPSTLGNVL